MSQQLCPSQWPHSRRREVLRLIHSAPMVNAVVGEQTGD